MDDVRRKEYAGEGSRQRIFTIRTFFGCIHSKKGTTCYGQCPFTSFPRNQASFPPEMSRSGV